MNIHSAIKDGSKILSNNLIPSAQLDSEILMAKTINKNRNYILLNSNKLLNEIELEKFYTLIKNRSSRKPIAYITNKKYFWNSEFLLLKIH